MNDLKKTLIAKIQKDFKDTVENHNLIGDDADTIKQMMVETVDIYLDEYFGETVEETMNAICETIVNEMLHDIPKILSKVKGTPTEKPTEEYQKVFGSIQKITENEIILKEKTTEKIIHIQAGALKKALKEADENNELFKMLIGAPVRIEYITKDNMKIAKTITTMLIKNDDPQEKIPAS